MTLPTYDELFELPKTEPVTLENLTVNSFADINKVKAELNRRMLEALVPALRVVSRATPFLVSDSLAYYGASATLKLNKAAKGIFAVYQNLNMNLHTGRLQTGLKMVQVGSGKPYQGVEEMLGMSFPDHFLAAETGSLSVGKGNFSSQLEKARQTGKASSFETRRIVQAYPQYGLKIFQYDPTPLMVQVDEIFAGLAKTWEGSFEEAYNTSVELARK